ncbi:MAG TPA: hypothetical protein VK433_05055 [Stellaceae bacterium]|nr:hypothetical protein [Stellaceae bacterium]
MPARSNSETGLDAIGDDLASLKRDLARLMVHVKNGTYGATRQGVADTVEHLSEEADRLYRNVAKTGGRSIKAVSRQIEARPFVSVLVAFGIGLIGGRFIAR